MSLQFYFGASGAGKSHKLYNYIIDRSMEEADSNFIVIVPEQFTMQTQKDLVLMHPRKGIMNIDVLSFGRLAFRIFDEIGGNIKKPLDDMGKSLILRKIASDRENELQLLGSNLKKLGYINEIKSVISEFVQYGIGLKELDELQKKTEGKALLQLKLRDIRLLYKSFIEYIQNTYITNEELLEAVCKVIYKSNIMKKSVVVLDGFTGFTPIQNRLLEELMKAARQLIVTITIDSRENPFEAASEQKLFYLSQKTAITLQEISKRAQIARDRDIYLEDSPVYRFKSQDSLAHLERNLFRYQNSIFEKDQDALQIISAANPEEELKQTCILIHQLVREKGYRYRDIAVVTGDMNTYAYYAESAFAKYEIPMFMDRTRGVLLNPFIEYIRAALEVIIRDYSYESVFRYLRSGMADLCMDEVDRIENYVLALGIRGKSMWKKKWIRKYKDCSEEELKELEELKNRMIKQLEPLHGKQDTVKGITGMLYEFIVNSQLQQKLAIYEENFSNNGNMGKVREYHQIYKLIMDLLNQVLELLGNEHMTLREYSKILDAGFDEIRVGIIPPGIDEVVVGDIERTRLKKIKALFFIGINDTIIPKSGGVGGIISELDREILREQNVELAPTSRQQAYRQRLYLYMNMTKPEERLFLSFSRVSGNGKSIRPAYLIKAVQKMFPNLEIKIVEDIFTWERLVSPISGLSYLAENLRNMKGNTLKELYYWYRNSQEYAERLNRLTDAAFYHYSGDKISRAVSRVLYGSILENSVTRLEKYAACAYAHFLVYGLRLKERQLYTFEQRDMGNLFHEILENYSKMLANSGYTWFDVTAAESEALLEAAVEARTAAYGETVLYSSARNEFAVSRMKRILSRTVKVLSEQIKKGMFIPHDYEVSFSGVTDLESLHIELDYEGQMRLQGRIDRVDTFEDDTRLYVKVIDYKSGTQTFDLLALYYGLQLQLVVYLDAAMELERKAHPDKEVIPAGILYYHIDDPVVDRALLNDKESIDKKIESELRMNGLVNEEADIIRKIDGEFDKKSDIIPVAFNKDGSLSSFSSAAPTSQFQLISSYVNQKIKEIGSEILNGNIEAHPYELSGQSACDYCIYGGICGFDTSIQGYRKHQLKKYNKEDLFTKMAERTP